MKVNVDIEDVSSSDSVPDKISFHRWVSASLLNRKDTAEIAIRVIDENESAQLNYRFRKKNNPTNVLSFPAADEDDMPYLADDMDEAARPPRAEIGDIAIAHDTCMREADDSGISIDDHVTHLFGHGVLHLLGYDHEQDADATEMEALEISLLNAMGIANPYGDAADDKVRIITSSTESAS